MTGLNVVLREESTNDLYGSNLKRFEGIGEEGCGVITYISNKERTRAGLHTDQFSYYI